MDAVDVEESPAELRRKLAEAKTYDEARTILVKIVAAGPPVRDEDNDE